MAEILLFHHIQGLTPGLVAFADRLRADGHTVHTPDLFEGQTFATIPEGMAYTRRDGAPDYDALADEVAAGLPDALVHAGFSFGVSFAQRLCPAAARERPAPCCSSRSTRSPASGASAPGRTACRCRSTAWTRDEFFAGEGELEAARELVATVEGAELFVYPGDRHLFADPSLPSYDAAAAALLTERVLAFLSRI